MLKKTAIIICIVIALIGFVSAAGIYSPVLDAAGNPIVIPYEVNISTTSIFKGGN